MGGSSSTLCNDGSQAVCLDGTVLINSGYNTKSVLDGLNDHLLTVKKIAVNGKDVLELVNSMTGKVVDKVDASSAEGTSIESAVAKVGAAEKRRKRKGIYHAAKKNIKKKRGKSYRGGGDDDDYADFFGGDSDTDDFFGGAEDDAAPLQSIADYESSVASNAKEDTVRRLARALKRAGIDVNPDGSLEEITKQLAASLPNPREGKTFDSSAKSQEKICRSIADVFNDEWTPGVTDPKMKLINTTLGPVEICRAVAEITYSFNAGVHAEFLSVLNSVKKTIKNLQVIGGVMDVAFENYSKLATESEDARKESNFEKFHHLYMAAKAQRLKQETILANLLNISLTPTQELLQNAMRDSHEQNALIKELKLIPGSSDFADTLARAVSGLGTSASIAAKIHKALKESGISVNAYLKSDSFKDFQHQADQMFEKGELKQTDFVKFLKAVDDLKKTFKYQKDDSVRAALEKMETTPGLSYKASHRSHHEHHGGAHHGGVDDDDYKEKGKYQKKIDKKAPEKTERRIFIGDFVVRLARHYQELLQSIQAIGPQLGGKFRLTSASDRLRDSIAGLDNIKVNELELQLIGGFVTTADREKKESFQNRLRRVIRAVNDMMELEAYASFSAQLARLREANESILNTLDRYTTIFQSKFGTNIDDSVFGEIKAAMPELNSSELAFIEAVTAFKYYYYVARVRENLERSASELDKYGEKYQENLGLAVAVRLEALDQDRADLNVNLKPAIGEAPWGVPNSVWTDAGNVGDPTYPGKFSRAGGADNVRRVAIIKAVKDTTDKIFATRKEFYRAVQAIDLYLKAFTAGIAKNPDDIKDIKRILDGSKVIGQWFNEETGENIWKSFEATGTSIRTNNGDRVEGETILRNAAGNNDYLSGADRVYYAKAKGMNNCTRYSKPPSHYYDYLANNFRAGKDQGTDAAAGVRNNAADAKFDDADFAGRVETLGVPFGSFPILPALDGEGKPLDYPENKQSVKDKVQSHINKAFDNYQALKNLISAFTRIGEKFGGSDVFSKTFMTPMQIHRALVNYLKQSALSVNSGIAVQPCVVDGFNAGVNANAPIQPYSAYFSMQQTTSFAIEDKYFTFIIKAMAAKVLTVLGVYDLFNRATPIYELTPTRMITGGAKKEELVPIEGAAELYFRLPRLLEFYYSVLKTSDTDPDAFKIGLIADFDSVFSNLIKLYFLRTISTDNYSTTEMQMVITEINKIYNTYRAKESGDDSELSRKIITDLITLINERYGVIKKEENDAFWKFYKSMKNTTNSGTSDKVLNTFINNTSFAILPGEENDLLSSDESRARNAPSDSWTMFGENKFIVEDDAEKRRKAIERSKLSNKTEARLNISGDIDAQYQANNIVKSFRNLIDKEFGQVLKKRSNTFTEIGAATNYSLVIDEGRLGMSRASSNSKKLEVAYSLISEKIEPSGLDANKSLMFNETVVVGLNLLTMIYDILNRFDTITTPMRPVVGAANKEVDQSIYDAVMDGVFTTFAAGYNEGNNPNGSPVNTYVLTQAQAQAATPVGKGLNVNVTTLVLWHMFAQNNAHIGNNPAYKNANLFGAGGKKPSSVKESDLTTDDQRLVYRALCFYAKYAVDHDNMMEDLVENLYAITSSFRGLVSVSYAADGPRLDFSGLRNASVELHSNVKTYMDLFRPYLPKETIARFEDLANVGSVYWLEENLLNGYFSEDEEVNKTKVSVDRLSARAYQAFKDLNQLFNAQGDLVGAIDNASINTDAHCLLTFVNNVNYLQSPAVASRRNYFGRTFARLTFYDPVGQMNLQHIGGGNINVSQALSAGTLDDLIRYDSKDNSKYVNAVNVAVGRIHFYEFDTVIANRSLMFSLNQLLALYLNTFIDDAGGKKIYSNLLTMFANGAMSKYLNTNASFVDLVSVAVSATAAGTAAPGGNANADIGRFGVSAEAQTIFMSLSVIMQRFMKDLTSANTATSKYLIGTLTDVPLYMKERMRANLPGFGKLFDLLFQKAEMIGKLTGIKDLSLFCEGTNVISYGSVDNAALPKPGNAGVAVALNFRPVAAIGDLRVLIAKYLNEVKAGSQSLSNSCLEVTKELGDNSPVYMSFSEGSIESYRMRYGKTPLTPLSLALYAVGDKDKVNVAGKQTAPLLPTGRLGQDEFKFLYGTRGLLPGNSVVTFDSLVGVKAILDQYNASAPSSAKIEDSDYLQYVQQSVTALRWVTESQFYKNMLATKSVAANLAASSNISALSMIVAAPATLGTTLVAYTGADVYKNVSALTLRTDVSTMIAIVEDDDQAAEVDTLVDFLRASAKKTIDDRKFQRVLNIIDMNVMPINIHALMRSVPLANLFNYNYTFDRMAANLYGEDADDLLTVQATNSRRLFLQLLNNPYRPVGWKHTSPDHDNLHSIFRGDANLGMGRPKFLSDQLYNKALLGSIYPAGMTEAADISLLSVNQSTGPTGASNQLSSLDKINKKMLTDYNNLFTNIQNVCDTFTSAIMAANWAYVQAVRAAATAYHGTIPAAGNNQQDGFVALLTAAFVDTGTDRTFATAGALNLVQLQAVVGTDDTQAVPFVNQAQLIQRLSIDETAGGPVLAALQAAVIALRRAVIVAIRGQPVNALQLEATRLNALFAVKMPIANFDRDVIQILVVIEAAQTNIPDNNGATGTSGAFLANGLRDPLVMFNRLGNDPVAVNAANTLRVLAAAQDAIIQGTVIYQHLFAGNRIAGNTILTYIKNDETDANTAAHGYSAPVLKSVVVGTTLPHIEAIAQSRFDTRFVRNLFFVTNVVRLLRLKLNRELTQSRNVVVSSHYAVASGVTEYGSDPFGVNQILDTKTVQNRAQFNFQDKF